MDKQTKSPKFSPEVRERSIRMVLEHRGEHASEWAAIGSIAAKIGCTAPTPPENDAFKTDGLLLRTANGKSLRC